MNTLIDLITNDYYKIILIIQKHQVTVDNQTYCPLSQEEIANIAGLSRNTVGSIIKKLKQNDFIHSVEGKTKRYFLDKKTTKFIKALNNIKECNY